MITKSQRLPLAIAATYMAVVAYCDAHTIDQISLWPLYIAPVILVSWTFGFVVGVVFAWSACALLVLSTIFSGHPYSGLIFFLLATLCQTAALVTIAWFTARLAAVQSALKKLLSSRQT
jgi:hypothetical protein